MRCAFKSSLAAALAAVLLLLGAPALAQQPNCTIGASPPADSSHPNPPGTQVTLTANCTNNPTSYSWSPGGGTTQSIVVAPTSPTQYCLHASNAAGASDLCYTVNVTGVPFPTCMLSTSPPAGPSTPVAPGTQVTVTATCTGNPTYSWSPGGATTASIVVAPAVTTKYTLTFANSAGTGTISLDVNVGNGPSPVCSIIASPPASPSSPVAPGTQVTLTANCANNPTSYSWSPSGGTTQSIVVAPTVGTQYTLTARNAAGANTLSYYVNVGTPVFPLAISGTITSTAANITASIQFRPQDVGTTGSVYVFFLAPSSLVHGAVQKDGPCVLAQLDSSGQLQAATASALQAYTTGTLSSQGQSVAMLNNVPTPNVAGATGYVGYGTTSNSMFGNGVYQGAVSVPGTVTCPASAVSYEGLWLKADESGWGLNVTEQGTILFATWFTYDTDGSGMWLVGSSIAQTTPGNFTGSLYRTTGPAFNTVPFTAIAFPANYTEVGTLTLAFNDANTGTMSYVVNGVSQSKAITRFIYATGGTSCTLIGAQGISPNYQDLWLKTDEAGWGVNLSHQGDILFATWFTYQAGGKGQWLVMSNGSKTAPGVYTGALQRTTGPAFSAAPFNPSSVSRTTVGSATFTFSDANNGTFTYTVDGTTQSKPIARYVYSSPPTVCQ